jgi:eukaryotic-like serine/threonine-protein kinase
MPAEPNPVKSIFLAAAEKPATERMPFLEQACAGDKALRQRIEKVLATLDSVGAVNDKTDPEEGSGDEHTLPPEQSGPANARAATSKIKSFPMDGPENRGARLGPYKLLKQLGEGGMGTVWMAEQTEPVKRILALKVIKPGMVTGQVIARFEAERQAIALMDHPNIAKVLDAGTTNGGRPFFAMELVKGAPITKYCDDNQLTLRQRLELFMQVCQGLQHAHQKGIIHRDIKPSNVLVANYDGKAVPKIIDFGVAKATGQKLTDRTMFTGFGAVVGTVEYMSPEQAEPNQMDIDTRSDIYALGIMLYELVTGTTPLSLKRANQAGMAEVLRIIREEDPPKPSTRLSQSRETLATVAAQRQIEPAKLTNQVRGELDWLVMKALEKDRNRRYETANSFAQDVQRYLNDEPVLASPPSATYRLKKFVKRNKGKLLAAAAVLLALVGGMVGTTAGLLEARQQRDVADLAREQEAERRAEAVKERDRAQSAKAEAVSERDRAKRAEADALAVLDFFQEKVLAAAGPKDQEGGLGINATIREAVDAAEPRIGEAFRDSPPVEASIRNVIGIVYGYLGDYQLAVKQHQKALALLQANLGVDHPETLQSMNNLGEAYRNAHRVKDALPLFEETLKLRQIKLGNDDPATLTSMNNLALAYEELALASKDAKLLREEAIPLFEKTLALRKAKLGSDHQNTLKTMNNLAWAYFIAGRLKDALPLFEQTLELQKTKLGADNLDTLTTMYNLARAYPANRRNDALPLFEETFKLRKAKLGPEHRDTLRAMNDLAGIYRAAKRYSDAEPLYRDLAAASKKIEGADSLGHASQLASLGDNLVKQHKYMEAEQVLRDCLAIREEKQPDAWTTFNSNAVLGGSLLGQKMYADAEPMLLQGYKGMKQRADKMGSQNLFHVTDALLWIVQLYEATGQQDEALRWRKELELAKGSKKQVK